MQEILNEQQLLDQLNKDIESLEQDSVTILAGHFPLRVDKNTKEAYADLFIWGDFSTYTLELGCKVGQQAKKLNKNVQFILVCDDIMYQDEDKSVFAEQSKISDRQQERRLSAARKKFYEQYSGMDALLPNSYIAIFEKYGFGVNDIIRQNQNKPGRESCLYFSEIVLKNAPAANSEALQQVNTCSRAYIALLDSGQLQIQGETPYLISFVPNKCSHYVCDAVDFFVKDFKGSHVFMDTFEEPKKEQMYERGVFYKKDAGFNKVA